MAKKVITKKARVSVVKKRWYSLEAPKMFNNVVFGETPTSDPKNLVGRSVKTSLKTFVKTGKRQAVEVKLRVSEVKGSSCVTELESLTIPQPMVKRLVRRAKKRVDDSFIVVTKDETKVRLKPMLLVKDNVQHGILTDLRALAKGYYTELAKELTFSELVNKIIQGDSAKELKQQLRKVYPVSIVEMRALVREMK